MATIVTPPATIKVQVGSQQAAQVTTINQASLTIKRATDLVFGTPNDGDVITYRASDSLFILTAATVTAVDNTSRILAQSAFDKANTDVTNITVTGGVYGNANTITTVTLLANGRVSSIVNTAVAIDGSQVTTGTLSVSRFPTSGAVATTYGNTTSIPSITVDTYGRITSVSNNSITVPPGTSIYANSGQLTANANTGVIAIGLATTGVSAATYGNTTSIPSVTVDIYGRITSISNNSITVPPGTSIYANSGQLTANANTGVIAIGLATTGTAATYGNSAYHPVITTDTYGRVSAVTNTLVQIAASQVTSGVLPFAQGGSNNTTYTTGAILTSNGTAFVALANTGTAGTYANSTYIPVITTDAYGRVTGVNNTAIQASTTSVQGIVQLTDSISSTSTTTAATPNSVKTAYDLAATKFNSSGGTITGDTTITGNFIVNGTTTTVNTSTVTTSDSLIKLANNNIISDTLDIGFYGAANTGIKVTYQGLARQAGSNNFLLFKGLTNDPSGNILTAGSATAANVATLIANITSYSITSNGIDLFAFSNNAYNQANTAAANIITLQGGLNTANANISYLLTTANNALPNTGSLITVNSSSQFFISNTAASTSNTTGALVVAGGIGSNGAIYTTGGSITINNGLPTTGNSGTIFLGDGTFTKTFGSGWTFPGSGVTSGTFTATTNPSFQGQLGSNTTTSYALVGTAGVGMYFPTNGLVALAANSANALFVSAPTGGVNYLQVTGSNTGNAVVFSSAGSDTNISMLLKPKGTGAIDLATGTSGVNISNGNTVTAITKTLNGSGYTSVPSVAISAPTTAGGVQATANAYMFIATATVSSGGSGYSVGDVLTVTGGTGTGGTLTVATLSGSAVATVTISNVGFYSVLPTNPVSVTGGTGSGATFNLASSLNSVVVGTAGSGYVEQPTVSFSGGGGSGAAAYATVGSVPIIRSLFDKLDIYASAGQVARFNSSFHTGTALTDFVSIIPTNFGAPTVMAENSAGAGNLNLRLSTSGTGAVDFMTNRTSQRQFQVSHTASAVNYLQATGSATTIAPILSAQGSDTNIDLTLTSKGNGNVNITAANTIFSGNITAKTITTTGGAGIPNTYGDTNAAGLINGNLYFGNMARFNNTSEQIYLNHGAGGWGRIGSAAGNTWYLGYTTDGTSLLWGSANNYSNGFVVIPPSSNLAIQNTSTSTSNTTGVLIVSGGVGIKGNLYSGAIVVTGPTSNGITFADGTTQYTANAGTGGGGTFTGGTVTGATQFTNTTASTSNSTGALTVTGGVGVTGNVYIGYNSVMGFANSASVSASYTYYNQGSNSMDTVFA